VAVDGEDGNVVPRALEDLQMLGHRLPADRKLVSDLPDRAGPLGQALHDGEPAGITQCLPAPVSFVSRHE